VLLAGLSLVSCGPFGNTQPIQAAVLGGTQEAFTAKFGAATNVAPLIYEYATSMQGISLRLLIDLVTGSDGRRHALLLTVAPSPDATLAWDETTAGKVYAALLPTDATHISDQPGSIAVAHIYRSAALAATFKAGYFVDNNDRTVTPGTFWVECMPAIQGTPLCQAGLGEVFP
jgi:hypothetical protein